MSVLKKVTNTVTATVISSKDNKFRYVLEKVWNEKQKGAVVISLSSGYADGIVNDYTTTLIVNAVSKLGYGKVAIMNLFANIEEKYRSDEENLRQIKECIHKPEVDAVIIAWGKGVSNAGATVKQEVLKVESILEEVQDKCYLIAEPSGLKKGLHPLRAQNSWKLVPWKMEKIKEKDDKGKGKEKA